MAGNPYYYTPLWRKVRRIVLQRDNFRCQIGGPKCKVVADQVDHIVPIFEGGSPFDLHNLRAACGSCNSGRAARRRAQLAKMAVERPAAEGTLRKW